MIYDALIVMGGDIAPLSFWHQISYQTLICTENAALVLRDLNIMPNVIMGDLDSLPEQPPSVALQSLQASFPEAVVHYIEDQNTTDFEKALQFAVAHKFKNILCLGVLGNSADHGIYNLFLTQRYSRFFSLLLMHTVKQSCQWIFSLPPECHIYTKKGEIISFFPFSQATLTSQGLKWELNHTLLSQETGDMSVRNITLQEKIYLQTKGSCLCFLTSLSPPHWHAK